MNYKNCLIVILILIPLSVCALSREVYISPSKGQVLAFKSLVVSQEAQVVKLVAYDPQTPYTAELAPKSMLSTSSLGFAYDLVDALGAKNPKTLKKLIRCESNGENVSRPDSDGIMSRGILQFHDGGTWDEMSRMAGIKGSPENPVDAIRVSDWMISNGYVSRWSCYWILKRAKKL